MPRRGPFPKPEKQDLMILSKLHANKGVGFNELWRNLKEDNISLSFTTLTKTLKRLQKESYVQVKVEKDNKRLQKREYTKTCLGSTYEQHLQSKLGLLDTPTKKIIKIHEGKIKYNQQIFSNFPITYELELSSTHISREKEDVISKFVGDIGETVIHNLAEILNNAYSRFLFSFADGSVKEAFTGLREGLNFRLKVTMAFDGRRVKLNDIAEKIMSDEDELLNAVKALKTPSQTELLGCWMMTLLSPLIPPEEFPFNLNTIEGWARLIEEYGNKWRKHKGVPLLKKSDIEDYLKECVQKGELSITPIHINSGLLDFKELPEPQPEEFYSFLVSIFSSMKSILKD